MSGLHDRPMPRSEAIGYANTFYGRMEELDRQAVASGHPGIMAESDQAHARMRSLQEDALSQLLARQV